MAMGFLFGQGSSKYDTIRCSTACDKEKGNKYERLDGLESNEKLR